MKSKFHFNLQTCTLKIVPHSFPNYYRVIPEEWTFNYFRSLGFHLDPDQPQHLILFSVYKEKIQVLYKVPQPDGSLIRYKRELTRPPSGIVEIEFSEWDQMEKKPSLNKSE